jgi:sigma-B regulation protein RsbU (phosphoserine phosphatase)
MIAVGGDFFDFIELDEDRFALAIGDVSDHGVPAALFMALTATHLRVEAKAIADPERVLRVVNRHLLGMNDTGMFVTLLYGILDTRARTFHYARAGHELPLILSSEGEEVQFEHQRGQPLGLFDTPILDHGEVELLKGSVMALYTDGITDTVDDQKRRFGVDRFRAALTETIGDDSRQAVDHVWAEVESFRGSVEQYDDLTLLILKAH